MATGYVEPSGIIWLFSGVPLSPTHTDVIKISSNATGFSAISKYPHGNTTYRQESYTRTERGTLRIGDNAENLLTCNYLAWQNRSGRYFYAFVTNVGYVNENCTEISYIIDNYMTWFDLVELGECFVEREIPESDGLFENLVPENLELGQYVVGAPIGGFIETNRALVLQASVDPNGKRINPDNPLDPLPDGFHDYVNGIPSNLYYYTTLVEQQGGLQNDFNKILYKYIDNGIADSIIQIVACPEECVRGAFPDGITTEPYYKDTIPLEYYDFYGSINGYTPKNKKLYSYPYQYLMGVSSDGSSAEYRFEFWDNKVPSFDKIATLYCAPTISIIPTNYKGQENNYDYALYLSSFPSLPWINDPYKAYIAQNKNSIANSVVSSTLSGLTGGLIGTNSAIGNQAINNNATTPISQLSSEMGRNAGLLSIGTSFINAGLNIAGTIAKIEDTKALPSTVHGNIQADSLHLITKTNYLRIHYVTLTREFLEIIDNYFSTFGYAVHKIKKPNILSRQKWNYTQTKGCILNGCIPAQAKNEIIAMFDNGVRFWNNITNLGDYGDFTN